MRPLPLLTFLAVLLVGLRAPTRAGDDARVFRAGAAAVDITPREFPVWVSGGFLAGRGTEARDRLESRAVVLDDGRTRLAIAIVDNLMITRSFLDAAKEEASRATGIPTQCMLIAATHTHSAPSVMGALGTPVDEGYSRFLSPKIVESIVEANRRLEPARIGWGVVKDFAHNHCRRWIYRPDRVAHDPFGDQNVRAMMHPGYRSADHIGPSGPADADLSLLALTSRGGQPLAVLANYAMHYKGAAPVSGDVCGRFGGVFADLIGAANLEPPFVGMLSQGTSGDSMWMDYSKPPRDPGLDGYTLELAGVAKSAYEKIAYHDWVELGAAETLLQLRRRAPGPERLAWARKIAERVEGRLPRDRTEVYALEAIYLHEEPQVPVRLQALRIGELGITALPNEVYGITGLKLKAQSPLPTTFNIELANGADGYIPPPAQHALGGYTTWPARTAGLEVEAEPKIVETLLELLEQASGRSRRPPEVPRDGYLTAVEKSSPAALWRLDDLAGPVARDASRSGRDGTFEGGVAFYLPGRGRHDLEVAEMTPQRAVHFAGGHMKAKLGAVGSEYTIEMWLWNGLPPDARAITGHLFALGLENGVGADRLYIAGDDAGVLVFANGETTVEGKTRLAVRAWHHVAIVRQGEQVRVYLDGREEPEIEAACEAVLSSPSSPGVLVLAARHDLEAGLEGRLDGVAYHDRALPAAEISSHYRAAGIAPPPPEPVRPRVPVYARRPHEGAARQRWMSAVRSSKPLAWWTLFEAAGGRVPDESGNGHEASLEPGASARTSGSDRANFSGGRLGATLPGLDASYSVELWFWNDLRVRARAVTGYILSRGPKRAAAAPGDHLGIGGTHSAAGRLIVFNGNARNELLEGKRQIPIRSWNHVVLTRSGRQVRVYLNGELEIDGELEPTFPPAGGEVFIGGRNDGFAPFEGRIEDAVFYGRPLSLEEASAHFETGGVEPQEVPRERAEVPPPPLPPRSPEESAALLHVREGYEAELVAAEPLVADPVAIDWDPDGRLWVAEMEDYPLGMDGEGKPGGRLRFLEDDDGDGRYDRSTVFLEGLRFPTGVLAWRRGVLVSSAPDIFYAEDQDGDGRADLRRVLYSGFIEGNQQLRVNGLRYGLDNWIYCASGGHHAGFGAANSVVVSRTGERIPLGSRDFRIRPDEDRLDPQSGPSQFGRVRDDWGNWFGVQNSYPIWHWVLEDHYLRRNPHVATPDPRRQLRLPANPEVYSAKEPEERFHSFEQSGRFTSACSPMIYRDDLLFPRGDAIHAFTCEPFHNLVQHHILHEDGVSFRAARANDDGSIDFFASKDRWCRPVMARTGPDGALWVVDMYRYIIEHPDFLTPAAREKLRPFFASGRGRGRIYRVYPSGRPPPAAPRLDALAVAALVEELETTNGTRRDRLQQLLVTRKDPAAVPLLEHLFATSREPRVRLAALCTLDGLEALSTDLLLAALGDAHAGVRRQAVRLAAQGTRQSYDLARAVVDRARDPDPKVQLQVACSLGDIALRDIGGAAARALGDLVVAADDAFLRAAVLSSVNDASIGTVLAAVRRQAGTSTAALEVLPSLLQLAVALDRADLVVESLAQLASPPSGGYGAGVLRAATVALEELGRAGTLAGRLDEEAGEQVAALLEFARRTARDETAKADLRQASIGLLGREPQRRTEDATLLAELLSPRDTPAVLAAVVGRLGSLDGPEVPRLLLAGWEQRPPALRAQIIAALTSRAEGLVSLLDAIDAGQVARRDIDPTLRQRLLEHRDVAIKKHAEEVFAGIIDPDRKKVYESCLPALEGCFDTRSAGQGHERGVTIFKDRCATCHRLDGIGHEVGPNLAALSDRSPESLLLSIIDPSQSLEPRYTGYTVLTNDGRIVNGIIASETPTTIRFLGPDGKEDAVLRTRILSLESSGASLMPVGLESDLSRQDLCDLIRWIVGASGRGATAGK